MNKKAIAPSTLCLKCYTLQSWCGRAQCRGAAGRKRQVVLLEMILQQAKKKPFKLDLAELHAVCEANYARLLRLFPDYENSQLPRSFRCGLPGATGSCRALSLHHHFPVASAPSRDSWLGQLRVEVRAYHDAGMLEVGMFQSHRKIAARYQYPNDKHVPAG